MILYFYLNVKYSQSNSKLLTHLFCSLHHESYKSLFITSAVVGSGLIPDDAGIPAYLRTRELLMVSSPSFSLLAIDSSLSFFTVDRVPKYPTDFTLNSFQSAANHRLCRDTPRKEK